MTLSDAKALAARLASDPMVEYAEPDVVLRPFAAPTEPDFAPKQWNLLPPTAIYTGDVVVPAGPAGEDHIGACSGRCEHAYGVGCDDRVELGGGRSHRYRDRQSSGSERR